MSGNNSEKCFRTEDEWNLLESEFVDSDMTYDDFAKAKDISISTLKKHAAAHNWNSKRQKRFRQNLESGKLKFDTQCLDLMDTALQRIEELMPDAGRLDLVGLVSTTRDILEVKYRIWNIPLPKQPIEIEDQRTPMDDLVKEIEELGVKVELEEAYQSSQNGNGRGNGKGD